VTRFLYALLIRLHPPSFRKRFAQEMLWIFDEAANSWGAASLLRDAILSLLRQRLIRSELWKWLVAGIAGVVPLIIAFGSFLPWDRPLHP
jgi:hypothetical protein